MHPRILGLPLAAMAVLAMATGCQGDPRRERLEAKSAVINIGSDPRTLDPSLSTDIASSKAILLFMRGLTILDGKGKVQPEMAESWETSADGLTWTFKLRPAKWSNGEPVTAADFRYAWVERMLDPNFGAEYAYQLFVIRGAREYYEAMAKAKERAEEQRINPGMVWVTALAPDRLMVQLEAPVPYFLELMAHHSFFPVCEPVARENPDWARKPETYIANGPFLLTSWRAMDRILARKNPTYWNAAVVGLETMELRMIEKEPTERIAFENGELDVTNTVPRADLAELRGKPELRMPPHIATYFLNLNMKREIFRDVRVRRALSLAVYRKGIVDNVTRAGEATARAVVHPAVYTDPPGPYFVETDCEEARRLLAEAGYPGGKGFPRLRYIYNTMEGHQQIAQVVQQTWKRELGIEMRVENQEFKVLIDNRRNGNFDVARNGWVADFSDPINFLEIFDSEADNNDSFFDDPTYDRLLMEARMETDPAEREDKLKKAEYYLMEQMPLIPIYFYTQPHLVAPRLKFELNAMGLFDAAAVRWEAAPSE